MRLDRHRVDEVHRVGKSGDAGALDTTEGLPAVPAWLARHLDLRGLTEAVPTSVAIADRAHRGWAPARCAARAAPIAWRYGLS